MVVIVAFGLFAAGLMRATPPQWLADYEVPYDELVGDGAQVWGVVYSDYASPHGTYTLLAVDGVAVVEAPAALPDRTLRLAPGSEGSFYAVAEGEETESNPSLHLWRRSAGGDWQNVGQVRGVSWSVGVAQVRVLTAPDAVIVGLTPTWSFYGGGTTIVSGPPEIPALAVYQPSTGIMRFGPTGLGPVVGTGPFFAGRQTQTAFYSFSLVNRSEDGLVWEPVEIAQEVINRTGMRLFSPENAPLRAVGGDMLWMTSGGAWLDASPKVATIGGVTVEYPLLFEENGYGSSGPEVPDEERYNRPSEVDMVVGRRGESYAGAFFRYSQTGGPDRHLVVWSHDYLNTYQFHDFEDEGHVGFVAVEDGFYLLRATVTGCALYRLAWPETPGMVGRGPTLALRANPLEEPSLFGLNGSLPEPPQFTPAVDLELSGEGSDFFQVETSTDLVNWVPLGLPRKPGTSPQWLIGPEGRRFFR